MRRDIVLLLVTKPRTPWTTYPQRGRYEKETAKRIGKQKSRPHGFSTTMPNYSSKIDTQMSTEQRIRSLSHVTQTFKTLTWIWLSVLITFWFWRKLGKWGSIDSWTHVHYDFSPNLIDNTSRGSVPEIKTSGEPEPRMAIRLRAKTLEN